MRYACEADVACTTAPSSRSFNENSPVPRGPFTSEVLDRVHRLAKVLDVTESTLYELRSEKIGPSPVGSGEGQKQGQPLGQFESILQLMDALINRADGVAWLAQDLRANI